MLPCNSEFLLKWCLLKNNKGKILLTKSILQTSKRERRRYTTTFNRWNKSIKKPTPSRKKREQNEFSFSRQLSKGIKHLFVPSLRRVQRKAIACYQNEQRTKRKDFRSFRFIKLPHIHTHFDAFAANNFLKKNPSNEQFHLLSQCFQLSSIVKHFPCFCLDILKSGPLQICCLRERVKMRLRGALRKPTLTFLLHM